MSIEVDHEDGIAVVRLQDAARMNSFDPDVLTQLHDTFRSLLADRAVRGIVLAGQGKVFCAGADIAEFEKGIETGTTTEFVLAATDRLHPMLLELHLADKPFIAAVNGVAAGGGLGLALAADARIGTSRARFAASYFGIGVSPDGGSTWLLPRLIGTQRARHFFFDNEVMDADAATQVGLLDDLVSDEQLVPAAVDLARRWGAWAKQSKEATKRLLASQSYLGFEDQLELERAQIAAAVGTKDFREGIAAFREKRVPEFA